MYKSDVMNYVNTIANMRTGLIVTSTFVNKNPHLLSKILPDIS